MNKEVIKNNLSIILTCDDAYLKQAVSELLTSIKNRKTARVSLKRAKVKRVTARPQPSTGPVAVYDIGMKNKKNPWFFGNNILVHNSCYFSAYTTLKPEIDSGTLPWDKGTVVKLYDQISEEVNSSFSEFMLQAFHCPNTRSGVIAAGREIVASSGLYITKKRYAALVFDTEGFRTDTNGTPGKVKAMGLDLRRADTPAFMQEYLSSLLLMVLTEASEQEILESITDFRKAFKSRPGWEKGTPRRVNNLSKYRTEEETKGKTKMPGHVRAALNWNQLKNMHGDRHSLDIVDGMKIIVCKLKNNPLGYTSIAYPVDGLRLPEWFKQLPFDHHAMEETIIDNKLDNLIGVLKYDIQSTKQDNMFNSLFDWN